MCCHNVRMEWDFNPSSGETDVVTPMRNGLSSPLQSATHGCDYRRNNVDWHYQMVLKLASAEDAELRELDLQKSRCLSHLKSCWSCKLAPWNEYVHCEFENLSTEDWNFARSLKILAMRWRELFDEQKMAIVPEARRLKLKRSVNQSAAKRVLAKLEHCVSHLMPLSKWLQLTLP